ncbi:WD-40 repeat-containing protein [Gloeopeniophorella convolvens]|nr:WD-40 repeat-containing protein [Gloeopeniophorella convolvens]
MYAPFDTILPADSVEFCPHPDAKNIFVCGTYKLEEEQPLGESPPVPSAPTSQTRRGQCLVFGVHSEEDVSLCASKMQEISLPAVLDLKWCHTTQGRRPLLAVADAEGCIDIFEWDIEQKHLHASGPLRIAPSHVLCLSLDWSNRRSPTSTAGSLAVSLSDGRLALLEPDQTGQLSVTDTWAAHDHEPWIVAWDYWNTNVMFSGGDDLRLKIWDKRQGFEQPVTVNRRRASRFDAGVTSIQSHPNVEHIIAVGSYDSTVRLFDVRKPLTPLTQADVGGGAWRVKWHPSPSRTHDLLVAAMHDGFKIVRFRDMWNKHDSHSGETGGKWEIQKRYDEHASLAYGVDWSHHSWQNQPGQTLIASASFYDHALHLWRG